MLYGNMLILFHSMGLYKLKDIVMSFFSFISKYFKKSRGCNFQ